MNTQITQLAKANLADVVGFAPAERFSDDDPIFRIMPEVKTVIGLGFRVLRGAYRGIEEGSTYYQYTTMAVETMEEVIMPGVMLQIANFLETAGYTALPQRRHQTVMTEENGVNPEVSYKSIHRGVTNEPQMDFPRTAVKCGLGELGLHGALLNEEFGPFIRYCFVLTDAELKPTPEAVPTLCDRCGKCVAGCPGKAIAPDGAVDDWRCAVYYNGAYGATNPFMPPDAFEDFADRLDIIAGEADIIPEKAKQILDAIYFYPPAMHNYPCSICGRACDIACYVHLEESGKLKRKFHSSFRKRKPWRLDVDVFK